MKRCQKKQRPVSRRAGYQLAFLALLSYSEAFGKTSGGPPAPREWQGSLGQLFSQIDTDGDGQIEASEAARYIGDSTVGPQDLQCMQANVDGADQGDTISENELQSHLQSLMKASCHGSRSNEAMRVHSTVGLHSTGVEDCPDLHCTCCRGIESRSGLQMR